KQVMLLDQMRRRRPPFVPTFCDSERPKAKRACLANLVCRRTLQCGRPALAVLFQHAPGPEQRPYASRKIFIPGDLPLDVADDTAFCLAMFLNYQSDLRTMACHWLLASFLVASAGVRGLRQRGHSDHPAARSSFATKGNINADGPEERLATTQPASQGTRIFWPSGGSVRHIFACSNTGAQKIGGPSCPYPAHGHDLPNKSGHRVGLNDTFDRGSTVGIIDVQKGTGRPKRRFTGGCPQREISHARRAFKANSGQPLQPVGGGVKQSA